MFDRFSDINNQIDNSKSNPNKWNNWVSFDLLTNKINHWTNYLKSIKVPEEDIHKQLNKFQTDRNRTHERYQNNKQERLKESQTSLSELKNNVVDNLDKSKIESTIYNVLHINKDLNKNNPIWKFTKWIVDWAILENVELVKEVIKNPSVLLDVVKQLFSIEWLKQIAQSLWKSALDLISWDPYKTGKSIWELWIITTGAWAWVALWKKAFKTWAKELVKEWVEQWIKKWVKETLKDWAKETIIIWWKTIDKAEEFLKTQTKAIQELWRNLNKEQINTIFNSHLVWANWVWKYTFAEIAEKYRILRKWWFSDNDARILMESWTCWVFDRMSGLEKKKGDDMVDWNLAKSRMEIFYEKKAVLDTKAVDILWDMRPEKVNWILKEQIGLIKDNTKNLNFLSKEVDLDWVAKENLIYQEALIKTGNEWLEARLWNLRNVIRYVEDAPKYFDWPDLVSIQKYLTNKTIEDWMWNIMTQIKKLESTWKFIADDTNRSLIVNLYNRINNLK